MDKPRTFEETWEELKIYVPKMIAKQGYCITHSNLKHKNIMVKVANRLRRDKRYSTVVLTEIESTTMDYRPLPNLLVLFVIPKRI